MIKRLLPVFLLLYIISRSYSQSSGTIPVYAVYKEGDSIHRAIQLFFSELKKGYDQDYGVNSVAAYNKKGILLITTRQAIQYKISFPASLPSLGPEGIFIRGDLQSVVIIGNTGLALQEAIYIYLEQLGFRYLMPGAIWEVIPKLSSPYIKAEILSRPLYEWREIANAHGYGDRIKIGKDFNNWFRANRLGGSFRMWIGHSYDEIVQNNLEEFKNHPEYFAESVTKGTIPPNPKFNVSNKNLVELVSKDAVKRMKMIRHQDSGMQLLSMEPSDGGGFCSSSSCKTIGTPSDQVFFLANSAAKMIQKEFPGAWVGSLAYNEHILPTNLPLERNVFVMVTNGFNRTEYTTNELLKLWGKKAKKIGVYEYLSVYEWDNDLPGQVNAAKTEYLLQSIKGYYENGARAYNAESVMGWVSKGWGQYLLSRLLWDYHVNVDSLKNDFFEKGFEDAAPLIRQLYDSWEKYQHRIPRDNDMVNWMNIVQKAYEKVRNEKTRQRINLLKIYLHYLVLYRNLKTHPTKENYFAMMHYAFRTFETAAFATLPTMVSLGNYAGFSGMGYWDKSSDEWKATAPKTMIDAEVQADFRRDIQSIKKIEGIKEYPIGKSFINLSSVIPLQQRIFTITTHTFWGFTELIIQIKNKSPGNYFLISSGYSAAPDNARKVKVSFFPFKPDKDILPEDKPVVKYEQVTKGANEKFSLASLEPGYYIMQVEDWKKMFTLNLSHDINYSVVAKPHPRILTTSAGGLNSFYFIVPANTKKFIVNKTASLELLSPTGRIINKSNNTDESFEVSIQKGEEGLWEIFHQVGNIYLEGVPPYFGGDPKRMIVPSYLK